MIDSPLPSDVELVDAAGATYDPNGVPFIESIQDAIRVFLMTRADGLNIIAIEGTHSIPGWMLDFFAINALDLPVAQLFRSLGVRDHPLVQHPTLGLIHAGFYVSAQSVMPRLALIAARGPYALCGHSLGAALALLIGALFIAEDTPPVKIAAFAPPRVGDAKFVKLVSSVPSSAWKWGNDPVPGVPFYLPDFPYEQVPLTKIGHIEDDAFACHAFSNYSAAVHAANVV